MLLGARGRPAGRAGVPPAAAPPARPGAPSWPRSASAGRPGYRVGGATCRPRCCSAPSRCSCSRWPGPRSTSPTPAPGGHRDPGVRRVVEHDRHRPRRPTRMDAAKAAARTLRRAPADPTVRVGVVAFGDSGLVTQQPTTDRASVLAAIDRLHPAGRHGAGQRAADLALRRSPGRPCWSTSSGRQRVEAAGPDLGYHGSAAVVLLSDGENTVEPDPVDVAELASSAGVKVYPIGIGQPAGHRDRGRRLPARDRAGRAAAAQDRRHDRRALLRGVGRAGAGRRRTTRSTWSGPPSPSRSRSPPCSRRRPRCCCSSGPPCRCCGSGG